jgi:NADH-quinone oxidoreductase subunit I
MSVVVRRPSPWQTLKSIGLAMSATARNFVRSPTTVMYPEQTRQYPERFRALVFALTHDPTTGEENCIGCRMCEHICPSIAIKVVPEKRPDKAGKARGWAKEFFLDLNTCIFCELCVQVCPTDAIVMAKVWEASVYERRDFVLDRDALHANEAKYPLAWATGSRLRDMQGPPAKAPAEGAGA